MPRGQKANERIREEQRDKILEAAKRVFAHKGVAATMDDVAREAGVSHGLAYRYFDDKEAILRALVEQALQAPAAGLEVIQKMPGTPSERLEQLIFQFVKSRRDRPEFYQLLDHVLNDEAMPYDFRRLLHRRRRALQTALRQLIVEGQEAGEIVQEDPDMLVRAIFTCLDGLTRSAVYDREPYDKHFPEARVFLRMLKR